MASNSTPFYEQYEAQTSDSLSKITATESPNDQQLLVPTNPVVAEWCHQMHIQQHRTYWWCTGCFSKSQPLHIPREQVLRLGDSTYQPGHAYQ